MSPTRKPNPLDRGVPAGPKPSRKVALEEVLRSLQDLVQNELNVDSPTPASPPDARKNSRAQSPEPNPDDSADTSLDETIILESPAEPDTTAEADSPLLTRASAPPDPTPALNTADTPRAIPRGGLQQELPYLDETTAAVAVGAAQSKPSRLTVDAGASTTLALAEEPGLSIAPEPAPETVPEPVSDPVLDIAEPPRQEPEPPAATAASPGEIADFGDIPILEDAVELSDDFPTLGAPDADPAPAAPLLAARDARRLAIQVAARLNVTLRKEGKPVLTTDVIARLARELEEALAKDGANMENKRR